MAEVSGVELLPCGREVDAAVIVPEDVLSLGIFVSYRP